MDLGVWKEGKMQPKQNARMVRASQVARELVRELGGETPMPRPLPLQDKPSPEAAERLKDNPAGVKLVIDAWKAISPSPHTSGGYFIQDEGNL